MRQRLRLLFGVSLLLGLSPAAGFGGPLTPATFYEGVGIGGTWAMGSALSLPELVTLSVSNAETANRGSGTGFARASGILPVASETELHLAGGPSISGIGGTSFVETRYQFMIRAREPGPQELVGFLFRASGFVSVDSNQPVGLTFARLTTPFGQFEASNEDPWGWHMGMFDFEVNTTPRLLSDTPHTLIIYLHSHGEGTGPDYYFNSYAFLDPTIELSPGGSARYEVVFSPGILPQGPAVPEPASLWLVTTGLFGLGARTRRRRG